MNPKNLHTVRKQAFYKIICNKYKRKTSVTKIIFNSLIGCQFVTSHTLYLKAMWTIIICYWKWNYIYFVGIINYARWRYEFFPFGAISTTISFNVDFKSTCSLATEDDRRSIETCILVNSNIIVFLKNFTIWINKKLNLLTIIYCSFCFDVQRNNVLAKVKLWLFIRYRGIPKVTGPVVFDFSRRKGPLLLSGCYFKLVENRL